MPLPGVIAFVVALMLGFAVLPTWGTFWSYFALAGALFALIVAMVIVAAGENLPYLRFRVINARDLSSRTGEAVELE